MKKQLNATKNKISFICILTKVFINLEIMLIILLHRLVYPQKIFLLREVFKPRVEYCVLFGEAFQIRIAHTDQLMLWSKWHRFDPIIQRQPHYGLLLSTEYQFDVLH